jgi:parallel beta-helix repeat protein
MNIKLSIIFIFMFMVVVSAQAATYTVTNNGDNGGVNPAPFSGTGTLRQALVDANANPGADIISFNTGFSPFTISVLSYLPAITETVTIDATSPAPTGYSAGNPVVVLDGTSAGASVDGLQIAATASGCVIRGLVIINFNRWGIFINNSVGSNTITGCFIGINQAGTAAAPNTWDGIKIESSPNNTIGGTTLALRNIISGNGGHGISISNSNSIGNVVKGNYIGLNKSGNAAVGNGGSGVQIYNASANTNLIGGATTADRNIISGNGIYGVDVVSPSSATIQNNYIGTGATGLTAIGNASHGITINTGCPNGFILNNVVSGNGTNVTGNGINIDGSTGTTVQANIVGVGADGTTPLGNKENGIIVVNGSNNTTVGGSTAAQSNVIGCSGFHGIVIYATSSVTIKGNYIGTNSGQTSTNLGNNQAGIIIQNLSNNIAIGGTAVGEGNVIANNKVMGIRIHESTNTLVYGNYIGTNKTGTTNLGNSDDGIYIADFSGPSTGNLIGGVSAGQPNSIAYNTGNGIELVGSNSFNNSIHRNKIYCNSKRGIELNAVGNNNYAAPIISTASTNTLIIGTAPANSYVEVFGTGNTCLTCTGNGGSNKIQGKNYLATVQADGAGNWTYSFSGLKDTITVTASQANATTAHNTSEFAACPLCPTIAPTISGTFAQCASTNGVVYTANGNAGSTFNWSATGGITIVSSSGNSVTVNIGASGGTLTVTETNTGCTGSGSQTITLKTSPSPSISGTFSQCVSTNGVAYSVTNNAGSSYTWSVTGGLTIASGAGTSAVTVNVGGSGGTLSVTETNSSGCSSTVSQSITVKPKPSPTISGSAFSQCASSNGVAYSVTNNVGSTYSWSASGGLTIASGGGTNSVTINVGSSGGTLTVTETNNGCSGTASQTITVKPNPNPSITGSPFSQCASTNGVNYSITNNVGSTYSWTATGGLTIASGAATNAISLNIGATGGTINVTETNNGCSTTVSQAITVKPNPNPAISGGSFTQCASTNGVNYSVTNNVGSTYSWTATGGVTITSGAATNAITVNIGSTNGTLTLVETNNGCSGTTSQAITVNSSLTPVIAGSPFTQCASSNAVVYSITNHAGSTYSWTATGGVSIVSGAGTNSISVNIGSTNGTISVTETSSSGCSGSSTQNITVNPKPNPIIGGSNFTQCANSNGVAYSVTNNAGSTYSWSVTGGLTIATGASTNAVTVNIGSTGGTLTVTETNNGCSGTASQTITVKPNPSPSITGSPFSQCASTNGVSYSVNNNAGSTYSWTVTGGLTIASGAGTNTVSVNIGASSGTLTLIETNNGCSTTVSQAVTSKPNPNPSIGGGSFSQCASTNGVNYSVTNNAGSTYSWTASGGVTITSGAATNAITVNIGSTNGTLTVLETNNGCSGTTSQSITVNSSLSPVIGGASFTQCASANSVSYSVSNQPGSTYAWTATGGVSIISGAGSNSITVNIGSANGSISLTETNSSGCSGSTTQNITVNPKPTPTITGASFSQCALTNSVLYSVSNNAGSSYNWSVTGGISIASGAGSSSVTVNIGSSNGSLSITETDNNGCIGTSNQAITVNPLPNPNITSSSSPNFCTGGSVSLQANPSNLSYQWKQNSTNITNATQSSYSATTSGDYTVVATDANSCSATAAVFKVNAYPKPSSSFSYTAPNCSTGNVSFVADSSVTGQSITGWNWDFGDANTGTGKTVNHTYGTSGNYTVTVTIQTNLGSSCTVTSSQTISSSQSPAVSISGASGTICSGQGPVTLSASEGSNMAGTYDWSSNQGFNQTNSSSITINPTSNTTYTVLFTSNIGNCTATATKTITIANPTVDLGGDTLDACIASNLVIIPTVNKQNGHTYLYSWVSKDPTISVTSTGDSGIVYASNAGNFQLNVIVIDETTNCQGKDSAIIKVPQYLALDARPAKDTVCAGSPVDLNVTALAAGNYSFTWFDENKNKIDNGNMVTVSPNNSSNTYYVTAVGQNRCPGIDTIKVYTINNQQLKIPNLITPNNDNHNDLFLIKDEHGLDLLPGSFLEVYNRWGERVFSSENYANDWGANNLADGMYYYYLKTGCGKVEWKSWVEIMSSIHR